MSKDVNSLNQAFSMIRDFRQPRGRRYSLQAILMLTSLAMMDGASSEQEVVRWAEQDGRRWLDLIGIRRRRGPSLATLHRVIRGIDRSQLSRALSVISGSSEEDAGFTAGVITAGTASGIEKQNFHLLNETIGSLFERDSDAAESQHISEAGLKIWGVSTERDSSAWRGL